jgi:hypothetical protein
MLNTIALISPFETQQVLYKPHSLSQKAPNRGFHPNENKTTKESKSTVP